MRSYNRFIVDEEVECEIDGSRDFIMLYNLSCGGCMIESSNPALIFGSKINIDLRGMAQMRGRVVWRVEKCAGIKFENVLHQKVVEFLGFSASTEDFDAHDPRDRFGIPLDAPSGRTAAGFIE